MDFLYTEPASSNVPQIKVLSTTTSAVHLEFPHNWNKDLRGYELHFKAEGGEWQQRQVMTKNRTYQMEGLECALKYQLYAVQMTMLGRGERSSPVSFQTQGSAPVAPAVEDFVIPNSTHLVLHLSSWQGKGCSVTRMVIEYRPHIHSHWTLVTNRANPEQQPHLVIPDLTAETWYVIRITAHNAADSTTREYDVVTLSSSNGADQGSHDRPSSSASFFEDTTTLVSMASSGVVLIAGIVAVVCLVMYKRRRSTGHHYRDSSSRSDVATTTALMAHMDKKSQRSDSSRHSHSHSHSHSQQSHNRDVPSYFSSPVRKVAQTNSVSQSRSTQQSGQPSTSHSSHSVPEYEDEIAPYATFQLPPAEENHGETEEFKTFSVHHGEPPYLTKSSLDPPSSKSGKASEELYQSQAPNSHSLTSGSSNQEELLRAYEYARRHPPPPLHYDGSNRGQSRTSGTATTESEATDPGIRQFSGTPPKPNERRQGACLTPGTGTSNPNSDTSSSSTTTTSSSTSDEATPVNTPHQTRVIPLGFGALPRDRSRPSWGGPKNRNNQSTTKKPLSKGIKKGLSSDESDSDGTIYTFTKSDTVASQGGNTNEKESEKEIEHEKGSKIGRGFSRRPPQRTQVRSDIIDC